MQGGFRIRSRRFDIRDRLGRGGMGVVYEAYDREHGEPVALKTLRYLDADSLYLLKNEFRSLQDLEHPNLVRLGELFEEEGEWFFTMELVRGRNFLAYVRGEQPGVPDADDTSPTRDTLRSSHIAVAGEGRADTTLCFDEERLRAAAVQLAAGLHALHTAGKVHRDVKPSNVLVDVSGRVVLLDFGLISDMSATRPSADRIVGTVEYMAPEQAAAGRVGPAADWYSFGVVLYEALTGTLPYSGRTRLELLMKKQRYEAPPPRAVVRGLPPDLDALCVDLLRVEPSDRVDGVEIVQRLGVSDAASPALRSATANSVFTQTVPFVGRKDELQFLLKAFSDVGQERAAPVTVFVAGESGMGKSELVRRTLDEISARHPDAIVLAGRCYERESVPYKAFDNVADEISRYLKRLPEAEVRALLPRDAALLGRLFPVLLRVEAIASAPEPIHEAPDPQVMRRRMFAVLRAFFTRIAATRRVVLFIDDFQWAGADSAALLAELLQPPDAPRLVVFATSRKSADSAAGFAPELVGDVRVLQLEELSSDAAVELVERLAPELVDSSPEIGPTIARESGGHPLFVLELVRHAEASGTAGAPARLEDVLWARINQLPGDARSLLALLAVAGAPISHEVAADALKCEIGVQARLAGVLRLAFFARATGVRKSDHVESYHDRVRESVLAHLDPQRQRHLHERLAIALEQSGAAGRDPQALVRHLCGAGQQNRAARYAEDAAKRAIAALAFDQAAALYRDTLELGEYDAAEQRRLQVELGHALVHAGRGAEAANEFLAAARGADATTALECRRLAAQHLLASGYIERGTQALEELVAEAQIRIPRTARRALASVLWHRVRLRLRGIRWKERHEREIADADLARLETYQAATNGFGMVDPLRGADFQSRALLLALRLGEKRRLALSLAQEAAYQTVRHARGRRRAAAMIEPIRRAIEETGDATTLAWLETIRGFLFYHGGEFREAAPHFARAEEVLCDRTHGTQWELGTVRVFRLFCLIRRGAYEELRALSGPYIRDAERRDDRYVVSSMQRSSAILWLVADRPEEGRRTLDECPWTPPSRGFHLQHWYDLEARGELALYEARTRAGNADHAPAFERLQGSLLTRVQIVRALAWWLQARLALGARDEGERSPAVERFVRRAARRLAREHVPYGTVSSLLLRAAVAKDTASAVDLLRAAEEAAGDNMPLYRAAACRRRGELMGGESGAALVVDADDWMRTQGVVAPERMVQVAAPGFSSHS